MNPLEIINAIVVIVGLPTILGACIYIGRKLQSLETLETIVKKELQPDLKEIRERFFAFEDRILQK